MSAGGGTAGYISTTPNLGIRIEWECKRDGSNMLYRFTVSVDPPPENTRFAYNLKFDLRCNGNSLLYGGTIKRVSPSSWSEPITKVFPSTTDWYRVSNIGSEDSVFANYHVYSTQTDGAFTSVQELTVLPVSSFHLNVKVSGSWQRAETAYVKVDGAWRAAKKVYIKVGSIWKEV